jgi:RHS repeat-associated protein
MPSSLRSLLIFTLIACSAATCPAQVQTGTPPFSSSGGGPFDTINLANLNAHFAIPVFSRAGRGIPFAYDLQYDTSIWYPVTVSGTTTWTPVSNWGLVGKTQVSTGQLAANFFSNVCMTYIPLNNTWVQSGYWFTYDNWVYVDQFGARHPFNASSRGGWGTCGGSPVTVQDVNVVAVDGSGYKLKTNNMSPYSVTSPLGAVTYPPINTNSGAATYTDRNGNQISVDASGNFTDTLGTTALTVSGSGTPSSPILLKYMAPGSSGSGVQVPVTVNYTNYTVATNFGVANIHEYGATAVPLVSSIVLADGSQYVFNYEATPSTPSLGACTPLAGTVQSNCVTARLTSITLPTGGTVSYAYAFTGCTGGNNGIFSDGSASCLKRTTPNGIWTYAQVKGSGAASTTTITDPANKQTVVQFQGIYETQRQTYDGSVGGTLLQTINTCYNGAASPCTGAAIGAQITRITQLVALPDNSGKVCKHDQFFNVYGLQTEQDDYDYGTGAPASTPLRKIITVYNTSLTNGIVGMPSSITLCNGAGSSSSCTGPSGSSVGTVVAQTTFAYDEGSITSLSGTPQHISITGSRGNPTTVKKLVQGTTFLTSTTSYYDTGNPKTVSDVNTTQTTYNYPDATSTCGNAFPTSVSEPLSLSRSMTWNCTGGIQRTLVDENGKTTTTTYNDNYFWRAASVTDPLNNVTSLSYSTGNPAWVQQSLTFNGNQSINTTGIGFDGLGRPIQESHLQAPGASSWDQVTQSYDSNGRPWKTSMPCVTTGAWTCPTTATTTTYDALGRVQQVTDGGGGYVSYSYNANDVLVTVGPAPSGENTKRRQLEYDALGRLASVCELTTAAGSGSCGQNTAATGFLTRYTYDVLGNLTGVTQNAQPGGSQQTRSFSYDGLSRLTSETNAESGTTSYSWDSSVGTTCGNTSPGNMIKKVDGNGNWTCYIYDALHRLTDVGNNAQSATNPCKRFRYDNSPGIGLGGTKPSGLINTMGRLIEAATDTCSGTDTIITDEWFSYTARGEVSDFYESTPHSGGYYHNSATYWANGVLNQLNAASGYFAQYNVNGEGRIYSTAPSIGALNSTTYNAAGQPTVVTFASNDSDTFTYDPNTGRMTQYKFTIGATPQSVIGNLTWNANGTLASQNITNPFNSLDTQNCSYTHDDLARITSVNCGAALSQTFGYDAFGNITKAGNYNFNPIYNSATNRYAGIPGVTVSYDAAGNLLTDGTHSYAWDAYGRPVTVDGVGLTYDAFGRMVEQNRSGSYAEINYAPTGDKIELMNGQSYTKAFVPLPGGAVAVYGEPTVAFRQADHLGNIKLNSTSSRTVTWSLAYAPFGETYASSGSPDRAFTSQRPDTVTTGLYDFPAREYSIQGRWPSPDPAGLAAVDFSNPQSWNRFSYVQNQPLELIDPLGLSGCDTVTCVVILPTPPPGGYIPPGAGYGAAFPCFGFVNVPCKGISLSPPPAPQAASAGSAHIRSNDPRSACEKATEELDQALRESKPTIGLDTVKQGAPSADWAAITATSYSMRASWTGNFTLTGLGASAAIGAIIKGAYYFSKGSVLQGVDSGKVTRAEIKKNLACEGSPIPLPDFGQPPGGPN